MRNADAFIALLEEKIATELLVLVNAESLPTDPDPTDPQSAAPGTDHSADAEDPQDAEGAEGAEGVEDTRAPGDTASADDPRGVEDSDVEDTNPSDIATGDADNTSAPGEMGDPGGVGGTDTAPAQDEGLCHPADPADCGDAGADAGSPSQTARPDPPPEDAATHHAHAGHRPAGDCRHAQGTPEGHNDVRRGQRRHQPGGGEQGSDEQGRAQQDAADGQGVCGCGGETRCSRATRTPATPGTPGTAPGAAEPELGRPPGTVPGAVLGTVPGLLLATGQVLPVSSVHRLARTSSLVRLVMDADGQVLDMGRKVRLATPAQRRAIYARYATCWIDGCPLPATMCQIDHADNWSTGGLTNLKLLGPACQFHNRDRYRHPDRYTRHKTGTDRWTFTYHNPIRARRLRK
ncbi:DUF222 domain-containing protein [Microbispora sp. KK1-11]|nr:DUF222 domain-containing protein [Microbispora sp. KK1-11]